MPSRDRRHHTDPRFVRNSKALRRAANANPDLRCDHCGLTLAEGIKKWGPVAGRWDADHIIPKHPDSPLRPLHAHCNRSLGATLGNRRRSTGYDWP